MPGRKICSTGYCSSLCVFHWRWRPGPISWHHWPHSGRSPQANPQKIRCLPQTGTAHCNRMTTLHLDGVKLPFSLDILHHSSTWW